MILRRNRDVAAIATTINLNRVSHVSMIPYLITIPRLTTIKKGSIRNCRSMRLILIKVNTSFKGLTRGSWFETLGPRIWVLGTRESASFKSGVFSFETGCHRCHRLKQNFIIIIYHKSFYMTCDTCDKPQKHPSSSLSSIIV